MKIEYTEVRWW